MGQPTLGQGGPTFGTITGKAGFATTSPAILYSLLSTLYSLLSTPLTENPADKVGRPCPTPLIYDSIPLVDMLVVLGFQSELVLGLLLGQGLKHFLKLGAARGLDQVIVKI